MNKKVLSDGNGFDFDQCLKMLHNENQYSNDIGFRFAFGEISKLAVTFEHWDLICFYSRRIYSADSKERKSLILKMSRLAKNVNQLLRTIDACGGYFIRLQRKLIKRLSKIPMSANEWVFSVLDWTNHDGVRELVLNKLSEVSVPDELYLLILSKYPSFKDKKLRQLAHHMTAN